MGLKLRRLFFMMKEWEYATWVYVFCMVVGMRMIWMLRKDGVRLQSELDGYNDDIFKLQNRLEDMHEFHRKQSKKLRGDINTARQSLDVCTTALGKSCPDPNKHTVMISADMEL